MSNKDIIQIDGSQGEGGGQVLRTSLTLSMLTGLPLRIDKIRAGRNKPGLLRQHLTAVNAAAAVSKARVEGAAARSTSITFQPDGVHGGEYRFAIGTAGSCTLVLQTILPVLLLTDRPSRIHLSGGTHNPMAPPADYLQQSFLPLLRRMGARVKMTLHRHGFYPAGGGELELEIEPVTALQPLHLEQRGALRECRGEALFAALPAHIAERELATLARKLGWSAEQLHPRGLPSDQGPGNALMASLTFEGHTELFTRFGEKRVSAERVAARLAGEVKDYLQGNGAVGPHLADQLLLPIALAGGAFTTHQPTRHTLTNLAVIEQVMPGRLTLRELGEGLVLIQNLQIKST
jgi:RNA 3'-terminal phosphate cyclase (ATP)